MATEADDDIVRVAAGQLVEVEVWQQVLAEAGIDGRVVGNDLTPGIGTALQSPIELWVRRGDAERAAAAIREVEEKRGNAGDSPGQPAAS